MQGDQQFHGPQTGRQMPAADRHLGHDFLAQGGGDLHQRVSRQRAQVGRLIDGIQYGGIHGEDSCNAHDRAGGDAHSRSA